MKKSIIMSHRRNIAKTKRGFSLVEILVSLAIFAMVVTAGTSAVLSAIAANQKAQSLNSVVTNLNLALESMAREIRLGDTYITDASGNTLSFVLDEPDQYGCSSRRYYLNNGQIMIERSGGCTTFTEALTAREVSVVSLGFIVCKNDLCDSGSGQARQPYVLIRLSGGIQGRAGTGSDFILQTIVSQRMLEDDEV